MSTSRRTFIKATAAVGGFGAFITGYAYTAKNAVIGLFSGNATGVKPRDRIFGNALEPEYTIDAKTKKLTANPNQQVSMTMCMGCSTICGVRVRIDKKTNKVIRVSGNPFHPLSHDTHLNFETPLRDAYVSMSGIEDSGLNGRSTACARGNAVLDLMYDPLRIKSPMKRVGPRGAGKWQPISFEQLISEVVDGGDLFGEGHVDGLAAIRDINTPLDADNPEYGPKANQLLVMEAGDYGQESLLKRFAFNSFGTRNFGHHGSFCGFSFRAGSGAFMNDLKKYSHSKPDYDNIEFAIFWGTSPSQAGNPFKRQGRMVAKARSKGNLTYVVVEPTQTNSSSLAARASNHWIPVKPGGDLAMAMGMIQWILKNERYNKGYLQIPGPKSGKANNESLWTNATHLIISDENHPRFGLFLRASDLNLSFAPDKKPHGKNDSYFVINSKNKKLEAHTGVLTAELFVDETISTVNGKLKVKSSLQQLKEQADRLSLEEYSEISKVTVNVIKGLAHKFTSHGRKAATNVHGGMMSTTGFYSTYAILMLNALIGSVNQRGGTTIKGGTFPEFKPGPRYNLVKFPGKVKPKGVFLSRSRFPYEKTSEYKRRVAAGESPYPTKHPWYAISPPLLNEHFVGAFSGYPYKLKAFISHMSNPVYGTPGMKAAMEEKLKDPKEIPLQIGIDAFINETNVYSDYLVPDSVSYESWGWAGVWAGVTTKVSTARWPVVEPAQDKSAEGHPITMDLFFIAAAKRMKLPGFGDNAIPDKNGKLHDLHRPEDFYLRAAANVAFAGDPVADVSDDDIALSGVSRIMPDIEKILKPEEQRKVANVYAHGGRFENLSEAYKGNKAKHQHKKTLCIYNEKVAASTNTITGKRYSGCPGYYEQQVLDGTPLRQLYPEHEWPFLLTNYKSNLQSSLSIAAERLRQIKPYNPVAINRKDALRLKIETGDKVRISTPGGSVIAAVQVRDGIIEGALGIEHGFGHTELGARTHHFGDKVIEGRPALKSGINLNDIGLLDSSRPGQVPLSEIFVGGSVRQALPAKLEKV